MKQKLKQAFSQGKKQRIVDTSLRRAAVLLPIYYNEGQYCILFTKRTEMVKVHKGQISFPGGAYEEEDGTLLVTALRECSEEIGLMPDDAEILGELDDEISWTSNYIISPFVASIPWPYKFRADRFEVEEIFGVPISVLLEEGSLGQEMNMTNGKEFPSYYYCYEGRKIWGATARILKKFLDILAQFMENSNRG
ncbi:NUDIX hydrolase [Chloroflexota bacterium]